MLTSRFYGVGVIEKLRANSPEKYAELAAKLVMQEQNTPDPSDNSTPKTSAQIAEKLLADVGLNVPSDADCDEALALYDQLISGLEAIRDRALH